MHTVPAARPPVQPSRPARKAREHVREVRCEPAVAGTGADFLVQLWADGKLFYYWLTRLPSDYGTAFQFEQGSSNRPTSELQAETYHICLEHDGASCECPGFLRHGTECKHLWAARELLARGELTPPPAAAPAVEPFAEGEVPF